MRQIQGYNYFSKFDCKSGFHQLKLTEESKQLTAFKVPNGFYEWNVLPFGYKNAPGRFQAFMDKYLNQLSNCVVYIDDILIYSKTYSSYHLFEYYYNPNLIELVKLQKQLEIANEEKAYLSQRLNYIRFTECHSNSIQLYSEKEQEKTRDIEILEQRLHKMENDLVILNHHE